MQTCQCRILLLHFHKNNYLKKKAIPPAALSHLPVSVHGEFHSLKWSMNTSCLHIENNWFSCSMLMLLPPHSTMTNGPSCCASFPSSCCLFIMPLFYCLHGLLVRDHLWKNCVLVDQFKSLCRHSGQAKCGGNTREMKERSMCQKKRSSLIKM